MHRDLQLLNNSDIHINNNQNMVCQFEYISHLTLCCSILEPWCFSLLCICSTGTTRDLMTLLMTVKAGLGDLGQIYVEWYYHITQAKDPVRALCSTSSSVVWWQLRVAWASYVRYMLNDITQAKDTWYMCAHCAAALAASRVMTVEAWPADSEDGTCCSQHPSSYKTERSP